MTPWARVRAHWPASGAVTGRRAVLDGRLQHHLGYLGGSRHVHGEPEVRQHRAGDLRAIGGPVAPRVRILVGT